MRVIAWCSSSGRSSRVKVNPRTRAEYPPLVNVRTPRGRSVTVGSTHAKQHAPPPRHPPPQPTAPTRIRGQAAPIIRSPSSRRSRDDRLGHLLPARLAEVPALSRRPHSPHLRAPVAIYPPRRLAGAAGQPTLGPVPGQRPRGRTARDGALLPARFRAARGRVRLPPRRRPRGRLVRVHREHQHDGSGGTDEGPLTAALCALYAYVYGVPETEVAVAAEQRALAMRFSDQWVREGCDLASPL